MFSPIFLPEYIKANPDSRYLEKILNLKLDKKSNKLWITEDGKSIWISKEYLYIPFRDEKQNQIKIKVDDTLLAFIEKDLLPVEGDSND